MYVCMYVCFPDVFTSMLPDLYWIRSRLLLLLLICNLRFIFSCIWEVIFRNEAGFFIYHQFAHSHLWKMTHTKIEAEYK